MFFCFFFPLFASGSKFSETLTRPFFVLAYTALVSFIAMVSGIGFLFDSRTASFLMCTVSVYLVFAMKKS